MPYSAVLNTLQVALLGYLEDQDCSPHVCFVDSLVQLMTASVQHLQSQGFLKVYGQSSLQAFGFLLDGAAATMLSAQLPCTMPMLMQALGNLQHKHSIRVQPSLIVQQGATRPCGKPPRHKKAAMAGASFLPLIARG